MAGTLYEQSKIKVQQERCFLDDTRGVNAQDSAFGRWHITKVFAWHGLVNGPSALKNNLAALPGGSVAATQIFFSTLARSHDFTDWIHGPVTLVPMAAACASHADALVRPLGIQNRLTVAKGLSSDEVPH